MACGKSKALTLSAAQSKGVDWMVAQETSRGEGCGGVLADEAGSGKTAMVVGLLRRAPRWPVLVCAPSSTLHQWVSALRAWMGDGCEEGSEDGCEDGCGEDGGSEDGGSEDGCEYGCEDGCEDGGSEDGVGGVADACDVRLLLAHQSSRVTDAALLRDLIGIGTSSSATRRKTIVVAPHALLARPVSELPAPLTRTAWGRVIVDEAHVLKSPKTLTHRAACSLDAVAKWAVTATPIQNREADLMALAKFVGVAAERAQDVRDMCVLSRLMDDPVAPSLDVRTVRVVLSPAERARYDAVTGASASSDAAVRTSSKGCDDDGASSDAADASASSDASDASAEEEEERLAVDVGVDAEGRARVRIYLRVYVRPRPPAPPSERRVERDERMTPLQLEAHLRAAQAATHAALVYDGLLRARRTPPADKARWATLAARATAAPFSPEHASAKLTWLAEDVRAGLADKGSDAHHERSVVFCEWHAEMALVARALCELGGVSPDAVLTFDGSLSLAEREDALRRFRDPHDPARVLLMQIRSGGCGLNLQAASRVYFMRPPLNPTWEYQAIARAYRRGQTRPVRVVRLVAADTADERALRVQTSKRACIQNVLGELAPALREGGDEQGEAVSEPEPEPEPRAVSERVGESHTKPHPQLACPAQNLRHV